MKKIAIVASGWHFPAHFYESMVRQKKVKGWKYEFYCVAHRSPAQAIEDKKDHVFQDDVRGKLDKLLYKEMASKDLIEAIGWKYKEYPNTIGDWGNSNQWLEDHDYKNYDLFLFTHDDNLIIHDRLFADIIEDGAFNEWDILANSIGRPDGYIRGSFEFFKQEALEKLGGSFDLSEVTLTREGVSTSTDDPNELFQWNAGGNPTNRLINELGLKLGFLSPSYRVSAYCIEGQRGYIANTMDSNKVYEDAGLTFLEKNGII